MDTGLTLSYLISVLESRNPASVEVCALLDKTVRRIVPLEIRYRGFECPDVFVVGYGLDFQERYRNIPDSLPCNDALRLLADRPRRRLVPRTFRGALRRRRTRLPQLRGGVYGRWRCHADRDDRSPACGSSSRRTRPSSCCARPQGERFLPDLDRTVRGGGDRDRAAGRRHAATDDPRPAQEHPRRDGGAGRRASSITELRDGIFYAVIDMQRNGSSFEISSRPSDAIALAVRLGCKIFANEEVLDGGVDPHPRRRGGGGGGARSSASSSRT